MQTEPVVRQLDKVLLIGHHALGNPTPKEATHFPCYYKQKHIAKMQLTEYSWFSK